METDPSHPRQPGVSPEARRHARGRQAVVYRALWQGRPVAIKRITTGHIKHMLHEIEIFR